MDEPRLSNRPIDWRGLFPWLHLFRAFRIAIDPRKLLLAGMGLMCLAAGNWAIGQLPFAPQDAGTAIEWPWERSAGGVRIFDSALEPSISLQRTASRYADNCQLVLQPLAGFIEPLRLLFQPRLSWSVAAYSLTKFLWTVLVWSLFGGAITRITAVKFARDERIGLVAALQFAATRLLSFFTAPLLPLAGIAFFWALCLVGGLVGRIPVVGEIIVGALWLLPLIFGLLMALILIGLAAGWPLMFATISAEGSDAFDGLSRSYSYVYDRPWHYLWYAAVATAFGGILVLIVAALFSLSIHLTGWAVESGMGHAGTGGLFSAAPANLGGRQAWRLMPEPTPDVGGILAGVWLHAAGLLQAGFVYSYFWTATTIIYFLLRKSADATEFDEVYLQEQVEEDELLPLVGMAASDQPTIERPAPQVPDTDD